MYDSKFVLPVICLIGAGIFGCVGDAPLAKDMIVAAVVFFLFF